MRSGRTVAGLPAADAATAVAITCDELAAVSHSAPAPTGWCLRALGESVVMTVRRLDTDEAAASCWTA
jgi:hypothetical protein